MVFKTPNTLDQQILYWWKILDQPQITQDELQNFIAFELFTFSLEETKKKIQQAIDQKLLTYDPVTEILELSPSLKKEFEKWQEGGKVKTKKMLEILRRKWRQPIKFDEEDLYHIYYKALVDPIIDSRASKILASAVKIETVDFKSVISGKVIDYPFHIDIKNKRIVHKCPEMTAFRIKEKNFCSHLGRVVMKLYLKFKEDTFSLLKDISQNMELWEFSHS